VARHRLAVAVLCSALPAVAFSGDPPAHRRDVRVFPMSRRARERQLTPGEWMLVSDQRGLWMPYLFPDQDTLVFRKRGQDVLVANISGSDRVVGVCLGTLTGRVELRSALGARVSPLAIWAYPSVLPDLPEVPKGGYYALSVDGLADLGALARLRELSALKLGCANGVSDLAPLAALTNLESLWLYCSEAADLSPLAAMTRLKVLRLDFCRGVSDLAPLARLKELQVLEVDGAERVSDIAPLAELPRLNVLVLRRCTGVRDLAPAARLRDLTWLGVHGNPRVSDLTPLAGLPRLATVELSSCPDLRDISPLASAAAIEAVSLKDCPALADVSPLAQLPKLNRLEILDCPRVTDLWPLRRAAREPGKFTVDWRLRRHLAAVQMASPAKVTLLMDGCYVGSLDTSAEGLGDGDGWCNLLGRSTVAPPALGLKRDELLYPAGNHPPGTVLDFSTRGTRVFVRKDQAPAQLAGVAACSPSGIQALREAIAEGTGPLIIWADGASLGALPPLPPGRDHTLVLVGLRAPIEPLARVRNLTALHIAHGSPEASDLRAIAHLAGLKTLVIRGTPRADSLRPFARLAQLTSLEIALSPRVRDLRPLAQLTRLKSLRLSCPQQMDFGPLASLPELSLLTLEVGERCSDLTSVAKLQNLRLLGLQAEGEAASAAVPPALTDPRAFRLVRFSAPIAP